MRVRFLGFGHTDSYRSAMPGCESPWPAREVRDVPDSTAEYLTETFPGAFKKEGGRPRKVAVPAPPLDRSIKSPEARPLAAPSHEDALKGSVGAVKAALASGAYDQAQTPWKPVSGQGRPARVSSPPSSSAEALWRGSPWLS